MKTLRFLLINFFVKDHKKTLEIIESIDFDYRSGFENYNKVDMSSWLEEEEVRENSPVTQTKPKQKSKKDELIDGLNYLKSKSNKTIKDKESIYTLEILLKNM